MSTWVRRTFAAVYGIACHGGFLVGVTIMAAGFFTGMQSGRGTLHGDRALLANAMLVLQFPLVHSFLLTDRGRRVLASLAPRELGRTLAPTNYSIVAAIQLAVAFGLWSPSHIVLWRPVGWAFDVHVAAFALAWIFLGKALFDSGLGLQTGSIGWTAAWQGRAPRYPKLPTTGLFARVRQPIYLGFALLLWTGPTWTVDRIAIGLAWTAYCALGPLHKERRFAALYGRDFEAYRLRTPYIVPSVFR